MAWAAVILAGGYGERLGGADKAALEHDGIPLLELALAAVAGAGETVVVGRETATSRPVRFTQEDPPDGGPLAGLCAGVARLTAPPRLVVVTAVDLPRLTAGTVARLVAAAVEGDGSWLMGDDGRRSLAGAVRTELVQAVEAPHGRSMRSFLDPLELVAVPARDGEADDVDTWADAARLGVERRRE